jgi:tetratricopeptide (TPR) repeat protein
MREKMKKLRTMLEEGTRLARQGCLEAAMGKFKEALKEEASDKEKNLVATLHRNIGMIHEQRGEMLKAKRRYLIAEKYGKPNPWTYHWLGTLSESRGELAAAKRYFARSEELATREKDEDLLRLLAKQNRSRRSDRNTH